MLNFSDISIRRGTRLLFEHATFNLAVAHVAQELDSSDQHAIDFVLDGDVELRAIEQQIAAAEAADDGHRHAELYGHYDAIGGYYAHSRTATLLQGLGFTTRDEQRAVREFSGGWRVRLMVLRYAHLAPEHLSTAAGRIERTWEIVEKNPTISLR